ncbi:unnamed protein product [Adineta steineri]|uniref:Apple domain-containing protein n=1 Tax=Adineta steineri TaxID=433720 RepID=A0A815MJW8_9BILA|nr:unnamed protein product [Adineta steineri]CAF1487573.1 unnamed protein product [Adineta steineri]CAF3764547.1 unnamed protein product [Adineta steineri]CAF4028697.1 unnamed protein product [Adineta steineri]
MRNTILLFLFLIIVTQTISQDIRTLSLTKLNNIQYQCTVSGCSSSNTVLALNLRACEIACLVNINCRTLTFDQSINQCELFVDIPSQYGSLITQANIITMTAIDDRQLSAPMTTGTTTSTYSPTTTTLLSTTTATTTMFTCISSLTGATILLNLTNSPSQNSYIQYSYNYIAITTSTRLTLSFRMDSNNWSLDTLSVKRIGTSTELLTNGDFESGTMTGWSSCNPNNATNFGFIKDDILYTYSGYYYWKDASTGAVDYLYQYFSSVVGANYTISFYLKSDGGLPSSANVYIGS